MRAEITNHFEKVDPIIYKAALQVGRLDDLSVAPPRTYFSRLCGEIVNQQLSDKAGDAIWNRFRSLFSRGNITSKKVLELSDDDIRNVGTSWAKVAFIKDLAQKVEDKELRFNHLSGLGDQDVMTELMEVKGIGNWTAEMFLMSALGREDIFSHGDVGLRRAIEKIYNVTDPSKEWVESITVKWSPYRSYGCRILWRFIDS